MSVFDFDLFEEDDESIFSSEKVSYLNPFNEADDDGAPEAVEDTSADTDDGGDLDVDTSLKDEDISGDDGGGDSGDDFGLDGGDSDAGDTSSGGDIGGGSVDSGDEEPVKPNTDIFTSLTKEEQRNKIDELKNLFEKAYTTISDFLVKLDDIDNDLIDTPLLSRITNVLYRLRKYTGDYIIKVFPYKSYIENEAALVRITSIINSTKKVIEDIAEAKKKVADKSN